MPGSPSFLAHGKLHHGGEKSLCGHRATFSKKQNDWDVVDIVFRYIVRLLQA